jgi:ABC-type Na+ efflux pump permease subunit
LFFAAVRFILGLTGTFTDTEWTFGALLYLGVAGVLIVGGGRPRRAGDGVPFVIFPLVIFIFLVAFLSVAPRNVILLLSAAFPTFPIFGAPAGAVVADMLYGRGMEKNLAKIIAACGEYNCGAPPGGLQ